MRKLRGFIPTTMFIAVLAFSTTFAHAGIVVAGAMDTKGSDPCTEKVDSGIVVAGIIGIVVAGFTGIVVAGVTSDVPVNCGIVVAG